MAAVIMSHGGRQWGNQDDNNGKEGLVEEANNGKTVTALRGGGRQKGGFKESSRRTATPMAPAQRRGWNSR